LLETPVCIGSKFPKDCWDAHDATVGGGGEWRGIVWREVNMVAEEEVENK
jgi:hypothetical protein